MATTFKLAKCSEIMDRLSLLPDEILSENILSHLPTKEAVRTSTLAHRWRFLWSCIPGLDLDFNSSEKVAACSHHSRKEIFRKGGKAASDYVKWVDQVVRTCSRSSTALRHFCICFRLDKSFSHEIDSWRIFSLGKGVEVLELDFCVEEYMDDGPRYALPSIQPHLFPKLRLLKSLYLGGLSINNDSLERLLLECQFLERLQLRSVTSLTEVSITGLVSRVKYIDIFRCRTLQSIIISARTPDLLSLTYPDLDVETIHIEHAPRLVDIHQSSYARVGPFRSPFSPTLPLCCPAPVPSPKHAVMAHGT
ncbi:putative F-box protein At3g58860 isoform X2 [Punica granatum]|uniref:F-box protein At3g58860 isoform X2 n=1 Tax=Punica granatum TaxID=22663 RepID=A0A6P8CIU6_PUNGR|nr:putative F-box protein At3g58860 isoform X2 [Punica granatum]